MQNSMTPYQPGPNVDSTTALLIGMKQKGTLQSYVASHRGTPEYPSLLALASSINNISAANQAAKYQQPTQTVAEQRLAGLAPQQQQALPENSGIGQLPADNLKGMAGGGIVAFDEGGEIPRYYDGVLVKDTDVRSAYDKWMAAKPSYFQQVTPTSGPREADAKAEYERVLNAYHTRPNVSQPGAAMAVAQTAAPISDTKVADTKVVDKGKKEKASADVPSVVSADKGRPAVSTPSAPVAGLDALATAYKQSTPEELMKTSRTLAADANKESEAAYNPYAEMLQKERADLTARSSDNKNMALLRAGLGMMGGTSQHALQNISKGGLEGMNAYQESQRLDDASKKALMGSEIAMMQAQRAERSGNHKDAVAILGQAEHSKEFGITAGMKAQELKQTGAYQQGMVDVYKGRNELLGSGSKHEEKKMAEYTKIQNAVTKQLAGDTAYGMLPEAKKAAYASKMLQEAIARNPFLASTNTGFVPSSAAGSVKGDYDIQP